MNQILVTKDNKDTSSKDIKPIVKFFCIACIIFAIVLGIEGGVKLYKKGQNYGSRRNYKQNRNNQNARKDNRKSIKPCDKQKPCIYKSNGIDAWV